MEREISMAENFEYRPAKKKKMIFEICSNQQEKLKQMPHTNLTFVNGSANFKMSITAEHGSTDSYEHATETKKMSNPLLQVNRYQCIKLL